VWGPSMCKGKLRVGVGGVNRALESGEVWRPDVCERGLKKVVGGAKRTLEGVGSCKDPTQV